MRKTIIAGNWKMNKSLSDGLSLFSEIKEMVHDEVHTDVEIVINAPFIHLAPLNRLLGSSKIRLGAQNCHYESEGAYTGEISPVMLASIPVQYVVLGHSERREYFNETDELLKKKTDAALSAGLTPIFCCGEPLEVREAGKHVEYVTRQLEASIFHLPAEKFSQLVIAYEPIWAIGTGKTATAQQAQEMHAAIREFLQSQYHDAAQNISILYGGSMKPDNAGELLKMDDVDGGLIGGASLKSRDFVNIIKSV